MAYNGQERVQSTPVDECTDSLPWQCQRLLFLSVPSHVTNERNSMEGHLTHSSTQRNTQKSGRKQYPTTTGTGCIFNTREKNTDCLK